MNPITFHLEISSKAGSDGRSPIMLRLGLGRNKKRISTKINVNKKDFNAKAKYGNWLKGDDSTYPARNNELKNILFRAEKIANELACQGEVVTLESLGLILQGKDNSMRGSFIDYAKQIRDDFKETGRIGTSKKYNNFINHLLKYAKTDQITFADITVPFVMGFELYLLKEQKAVNTVEKELKVMRALTYRLVNSNLMPVDKNPFLRIKIKTAKTTKEKLTLDEVMKIEELDLPESTAIWHTRNYFMFSLVNSGIRWGDITQLTWNQIEDGRLSYKMGKTGLTKSIELLDRANKILSYYEKYKKQDTDFIFPIMDKKHNLNDKMVLFNQIASKNVIVNKNLKLIASKIGLKKNLSFHIARHSFSDICRRGGMSVFDISKALGHSSLRITERYLSSFDQQSLDSSIANIFQKH